MVKVLGAIECCHYLAPAHRKQISAAGQALFLVLFLGEQKKYEKNGVTKFEYKSNSNG
jgi:hypothetical protein